MYNKGILIFLLILLILICVKSSMQTRKNKKERISGIKNTLKPMIYDVYWTKTTAEKHPDWLFVYGDNDLGEGTGGQSIIRGYRNTIGIPTKKTPDNNIKSYYTDEELELNKMKINDAISKIWDKLNSNDYNKIVFPKDGLGTGYAQLNRRAPHTYEYLNQKIIELVEELEKGISRDPKWANYRR